MNEVFLIGKVRTKVEFKFMYESEYISRSSFLIQIDNSEITCIGQDEMADWLYRNLEKEDTVFVYGSLRSKRNNADICN